MKPTLSGHVCNRSTANPIECFRPTRRWFSFAKAVALVAIVLIVSALLS